MGLYKSNAALTFIFVVANSGVFGLVPVQTPADMKRAYEVITQATLWAREHREEKLDPCSREPMKLEALCLAQACGLCKKYRQKGDAIPRYACPQPLGLGGNKHDPPSLFFGITDKGRIPVCRMKLADQSPIGGKCKRVMREAKFPQKESSFMLFFKKSKLQCAFNSYYLIPTGNLGVVMPAINILSAHAMDSYAITVDAGFNAQFNALAHTGVPAIDPKLFYHFQRGQASVAQGVTANVQVHMHGAAAAAGGASAEASYEVATPTVDPELIAMHAKSAIVVTEKMKISTEASAAAHSAQATASAAQAAAGNAASAKAAAETAAANAAAAVASAEQRLAQLLASIDPAKLAIEKAKADKTAADERYAVAVKAHTEAAAAMASAVATAQSLAMTAATARAEASAAVQMQNEISAKLGIKTTVTLHAGGAGAGGGVAAVPGVLGVLQPAPDAEEADADDADDEQQDETKKKTKLGYKEPWFSFHAGTLQYWIILLLFVGAVLMYFVLA